MSSRYRRVTCKVIFASFNAQRNDLEWIAHHSIDETACTELDTDTASFWIQQGLSETVAQLCKFDYRKKIGISNEESAVDLNMTIFGQTLPDLLKMIFHYLILYLDSLFEICRKWKELNIVKQLVMNKLKDDIQSHQYLILFLAKIDLMKMEDFRIMNKYNIYLDPNQKISVNNNKLKKNKINNSLKKQKSLNLTSQNIQHISKRVVRKQGDEGCPVIEGGQIQQQDKVFGLVMGIESVPISVSKCRSERSNIDVQLFRAEQALSAVGHLTALLGEQLWCCDAYELILGINYFQIWRC
ncbi:MAG: hypothetical protein EZS28_000789 [Streblomastix strix]|uniref:Uncharacterized protein n=1 Tax=Streblomastix strix TaxID=222440 RepID=A0A5J4XA76_9EUKA|nr:MAG: hypothetical protein EZS28_000789 [Streblomastix strix]